MKEITELSGDDADWVESLVRTLVLLGLRWVYVTDKRGTRLALYGDSKKTLAFPLDAVARRWAGEPGSLPQYVHATSAAITQLRAGIPG